MAVNLMTSALMSAGENHLRAVDIWFNSTIREVRPRSDHIIRWKDIRKKSDWRRVVKSLPEAEYPSGTKVFDAGGLLVIPGAIDAHVHFNTPGFEHRENFEHGSTAAISGGVTTIIDMPCTSIPPVTSAENQQIKLSALQNLSTVDYGLWGGISGIDISDPATAHKKIRGLHAHRVVGFKAYFISGMTTFTDLTLDQMEIAAGWIAHTGLPLAIHAEDKDLVHSRQQKLQAAGQKDWRAYCRARDVRAEMVAVKNAVRISEKTGCRIHIVHLSSARALEVIREAREKGVRISTETCPHYLQFTQKDFANPAISAFLKTAPPVKQPNDRKALWQGLADGSIDFVTTDHAGCDPEKEKCGEDFWQIYGGIPGVEHRVPFMFSEGFIAGRLDLQRTIDLLSKAPADFFSINHRKGHLLPNKDADLVLIDLWAPQVIDAVNMHSKGKYTPFQGKKFRATVRQTFLRGRQLMAEPGQVQADFSLGHWLRPKLHK